MYPGNEITQYSTYLCKTYINHGTKPGLRQGPVRTFQYSYDG